MVLQREEVQYAVELIKGYIEEHLHEPITARDLANAAGYSPYHAARLFKAIAGVSPFEYIRRERLTHSARSLRGKRQRVLDVALEHVFDSHDGFTRAFSNAFGITPQKYAQYPKPEGWRIPLWYLNRNKMRQEVFAMTTKMDTDGQEEQARNTGMEEMMGAMTDAEERAEVSEIYGMQQSEERSVDIQVDELQSTGRTTVIFAQIIERPARKLLLRRSKSARDYFEYCEEFGCGKSGASEPWDVLATIKEALYEPVGLWLPENMQPEGTGCYAHGIEVPVNYEGIIPDGFELLDLEPCKLMVFQGEPYDDERFQEAVGAGMRWVRRFNPEVYGYEFAYESAPKMQLEPWGWRGYIELHPVRESNGI